MKALPTLSLLAAAAAAAAATLYISTAHAGIPTAADTNTVTTNVGETIIGDARSITGDVGGGAWTEIVVNLRTTQRTSSPPLHGHLEIYERNGNGEERLVDRRDVDVPPFSSSTGGVARSDNDNNNSDRIHIAVPANHAYRVHFLDDRRRAVWNGTVSTQTVGYGALVFHYRPSTAAVGTTEQVAAVKPSFPERHDVNVVALSALPRSVWTYDRTALFLVDASTLKHNADATACTALIDWMRSGGTLTVVTDGRASDNSNNSDNHESARCGHQPLTPETIGGGRVVIVDKQVVESQPSELGSLLTKAIDRRPNRASSHDLTFLDHTDYAPRIALAGVLITLFGGVVGPGCYLFLYRRRRGHGAEADGTAAARARSTTTRIFPLLAATSLATLGAMLLLGRVFAPSKQTTAIVVRDVTSGDPNSHIVETRVFHKPDGPLRVKRAIDGSFLGEEMSSDWASRGAFRLDGEDGQTIVLNEQRPPATDYVYLVESAFTPLPGSTPITITCTKTTCTIDNASSMALDHARLHTRGRRFVDVGSLDAGTKRTVTLNPIDGSDHVNYRSNEPEDQLAMRAGRHVMLIARQSNVPNHTLINVTCVTGCEDAQ